MPMFAHKGQLRLMGMSLILQIFGHKPKYFDLMMALYEKLKITEVVTIHPEGDMDQISWQSIQ